MPDTLNADQLGQLRNTFIPAGHASTTNLYVESASGALIRDMQGQEYIDFTGGIAVMNVGHSHPKVVAAIKDQAEKFTHTCFMVNPYEPAVRLAEKLCHITPGGFPKKALFVNSGAEAVENAVKVARYYTKRPAIIVFENAYHGRTLLTMTMTSKVKPYKFGFGPFAPEVYRMPFGDIIGPEKLHDFFIKHVNPEAVAAVVAEPVQGEGGFIAPPPDYFQQLVNICNDNGILFVADEIQSGMGRTGKMFAIEHWDVVPDLTIVAKSLAAGMPLAAVTGRAEVMDAVHVGGLGGTYGGNPVACDDHRRTAAPRQQHRLIAEPCRVGVRRHRQRLPAGDAALAPTGDAGTMAAATQVLHQPDHQRRLAGTANRDVPHHDHRHRESVHTRQAPAVDPATQRGQGTEQPAEGPRP